MTEQGAAGAANAAPPLKYCLYARKSMESDERQALSIESQLKEMKRLAANEGLDIVSVKRESHSARSAGNREIFREMLGGIRGGAYNAILTWAPDRLSRNAGDLGDVVDLMDQKLLLEIRTFNQTFTNSPNEKFLLMILGSQAKLENDAKGVNVSRGLRTAVEHGYWPGVAPIGYLNLYRTDKPGHLKLDARRAPLIKQMFEKVANDLWSVRKVFAWLKDEAGFRTRGGKVWGLSGVYRALQNPFYYGRFEYPKGTGRWHKGAHKPIISKAIFDAVQERIDNDRPKPKKKEFAFTRLIHCGLCGSGVGANENFRPLKKGGVTRHVYYGCTRGRDRFCKARYIKEENLISEFVRIIDDLDISEIGMREKLEEEVGRFNAFQKIVFGENPALTPPPTIDIKTYAKYLLEHGSISEQREIMSLLKNKLVYKDQKLYLVREGFERLFEGSGQPQPTRH